MALNAQLYELILEQIRNPLEKAVDDALSTSRQHGVTPFLRLEAYLDYGDIGASRSAQNEAQRISLATIQIPPFPGEQGIRKRGKHDSDQHSDQQCEDNERRARPPGRIPEGNLFIDDTHHPKRRKVVGSLRLVRSVPCTRDPSLEKGTSRRFTNNVRQFPKRNIQTTVRQQKHSAFDVLIMGIWEQIHGTLDLNPSDLTGLWHEINRSSSTTSVEVTDHSNGGPFPSSARGNTFFHGMNHCCRQVTQASRCCRSMEVIVQARWIQCFDEQVQNLATEDPDISLTKARMVALAEASKDFGWSLKELRNKMAIWRGYSSIQEAGGWVSLIFAGMGLYRFCKYRLGSFPQNMATLKKLRVRFEVAADTIHPEWRQLLLVVGEPAIPVYTGHPYDWVVDRNGPPVRLAETYSQWTSDFQFEHLEESIVDDQAWGSRDPRMQNHAAQHTLPRHFSCEKCGSTQSNDSATNECNCFSALFGSAPSKPCPVQVFRSEDGRNNGLLACCPFERGAAIGEFVGVITKGLRDRDVMQTSGPAGQYQIWQGRQGNYTRFVNHSCQPNSQYENFSWLGVQRIVLVSKGISMGAEITVDYSNDYWDHLDKECLCGESRCRFKRKKT